MFGPSQDFECGPTDKKCTKKKYPFITLFDRSPNEQKPFGWYPRSMFSEKEIKDRWLSTILDHSSRTKELFFEQIPDRSFSLFGKMDDGKKKEKKISYHTIPLFL